ncbi:MAG TPA: ribose-phosphate diphosphokinase, partial [Myxococcota bacterium]|nr:ribose-phosphate diphosphokinase [Myxococcota bacterium]
RVRIDPRPEPAFLVRSLHDPNSKLFELLLAASALRDGGADHVTLVAPYLPYMRQDRAFARGEAVSQRVLGQLLGRAFERVVCVEPHLHRIGSLAEVFPCETIALSAAPAIARWLAVQREPCWVVGPDEESAPWIRAIGDAASLPSAVAHKRRTGDDEVVVSLRGAHAPCERAVVVDDIASSGATLAAAARAAVDAGAKHVEAVVVHAIVAPGAEARMRAAHIARLVSCDTLPHPSNGIETAQLIASALLAGPAAEAAG